MKRLNVLITLLAFVAASTAQAADFWLEPQIVRGGGQYSSQIDGGVSGTISGQIGYYCFAQALSVGYRQAYCGPNWKPASWLEVGVGVGQENATTPNRRNAYFSIDREKYTLFGTFENGGSGPWHKVMVTYKFTETVGAGLIDQSFFGLGPVVTYRVKKDVTLVGAAAYDLDTNTKSSKISVIFNF